MDISFAQKIKEEIHLYISVMAVRKNKEKRERPQLYLRVVFFISFLTPHCVVWFLLSITVSRSSSLHQSYVDLCFQHPQHDICT